MRPCEGQKGPRKARPTRSHPGRRRIEVDVLADAVGTVWALGTRDVSVHRGDHLILAELPATGLTEATTGALLVGARTITRALATRVARNSFCERTWNHRVSSTSGTSATASTSPLGASRLTSAIAVKPM